MKFKPFFLLVNDANSKDALEGWVQ